MKLYLTILFSLFFSTLADAEETVRVKPLMKAAKTAVKNNKGQEAAEKNLMDVVGRSEVTNEQRADIYFLGEELCRSLNDQENLKLYLKQPYDTIKFFSTILKMHGYLLQCDSVERSLDRKFVYRNKSRNIMLRYRNNLLNGGKFLMKKGRNTEAYPYFDMYLRVPSEPMFEYDQLLRTDTMLTKVAYWATIAAYNANDAEKALRHMDMALKGGDATLRPSLTEYKANCALSLGDSALWLATLHNGVGHYPSHDYFYLHLMDYYDKVNMLDEGIALSDSLLKTVGSRDIYWYGKSSMCLRKNDFDACIACADSTILLDSTFVDAYYNKGIAYLNQAIEFSKTLSTSDVRSSKAKRDRAKLRGFYQFAREPMERVRALSPKDKKRWATPLYTIYLNLNLGEEFAEMEKILNEE